MKHWLDRNFSQPAAFVARLVRHNDTRHIVFTSASAGEGTTTTVLGIARELNVTYGLKVLALEINPRSGGFGAMLKLDESPYEHTGESSLSVEYIRRAAGGYGLLTICGKEFKSNARAHTAVLLRQVLLSLADKFNVILIDAPPLLEYPETLTAAPEADGVVFVVESGHTRQEMLSQVRRLFEAEKVGLLGSVLTKQKHVIPNWIYRLLFK
ncbi:MAG: hypothetical protein OER87_06920 [Gammaproteobacteria bacterium]|nr:hypothetical protein [Gammaproteobacteria bacterium]